MANHKTKAEMTPAEYRRACANAAKARAAARAQAEARKAEAKAVITRAARTITRAERASALPSPGSLPDDYLIACVAEANRRAETILCDARVVAQEALAHAEARADALRAALAPVIYGERREVAEPSGPQFAGPNGDGSVTHDTLS